MTDPTAGIVELLPADAPPMEHYRPSGRIATASFVPLAIAGLIVSASMAYVMSALERFGYYPGITPAVLFVPVIAMLIVSLYMGKCRNRLIAMLYAATMAVVFYVGFWLLSYYTNVGRYPGASAGIERMIGIGGPIGYFIFRCKIDGLEHAGGSELATMLYVGIRGLEQGFVLAAGLYVARRISSRVFYEDALRWASSRAFGFEKKDLPVVLEIVRTLDWPRLSGIEKEPQSALQRQRGRLTFRAEYLPASTDAPLFVTVEGPIAPTGLIMVLPFIARLMRGWMRQRTVPAESAHELKRYFGGLDLGERADDSTLEAVDADGAKVGLRYYRDESATRTPGESSAIQSMFNEAGYLGTTFVGKGKDFRETASQVSAELILADGGLSPLVARRSLCYPASKNPVPAIKRFSQINLLLSFGFLIGTLIGIIAMFASPLAAASAPEHYELAKRIEISAFIVGYLLLSMQLFLFGPITRFLLARYFSKRDGTLVNAETKSLEHVLVRVEDPATFHVSKISPEDWGLCFLDPSRQQIALEGISHRYVIRGPDVIGLAPIEASGGVNVRIEYRICETTLTVVLSRHQMWAVIVVALAGLPVIGVVIRGLFGHPSAKFARKLKTVLAIS